MIDIIDDTDNIGPSLLYDLCPSQPQSHKFTARTKHLMQSAWTQVYGGMYCIWRPIPEEPPRISAYALLIFLETTIIGLHFAAYNIGLCSLKFFVVGSVNFVYFCKSDLSAAQGHPKSLILAPIESAYATSY